MLITRAGSYQEVYDAFRWRLPACYTIAADVCDRHAADPARIALIHARDIPARSNSWNRCR